MNTLGFRLNFTLISKFEVHPQFPSSIGPLNGLVCVQVCVVFAPKCKRINGISWKRAVSSVERNFHEIIVKNHKKYTLDSNSLRAHRVQMLEETVDISRAH